MDNDNEYTIWQRIQALYNERNELFVTSVFGSTHCVDPARKSKINEEIMKGLEDLDAIIFPKIMKGLGR